MLAVLNTLKFSHSSRIASFGATASTGGWDFLSVNKGYQRYLRSDHWKEQRLKRLVAKRAYCMLCYGPARNATVHHTTYGPSLWEVSNRSLKVLCDSCHVFVHDIMKLYKVETRGMTPRDKWQFVRSKARMFWSNASRLPMGSNWDYFPPINVPERNTRFDVATLGRDFSSMNYTQSDSGRSSFDPTEKRDCTVRAIAAVFGITYQEAHARLSALGRKRKRGCKFNRMVDKLGLEQRADLCAMTLDKALPQMQTGRFIVKKAGHVFAVVNGVVIDLQAPKNTTRIRMVYEIKQ